jgi:hypothetical protein
VSYACCPESQRQALMGNIKNNAASSAFTLNSLSSIVRSGVRVIRQRPVSATRRCKVSATCVRWTIIMLFTIFGAFQSHFWYTVSSTRHGSMILPESAPRPQKSNTSAQSFQQPVLQVDQSPSYTCHDGTKLHTLRAAPDLIIAGTQKAGSTALYSLLKKHPQILSSKNLFEAHFFDM